METNTISFFRPLFSINNEDKSIVFDSKELSLDELLNSNDEYKRTLSLLNSVNFTEFKIIKNDMVLPKSLLQLNYDNGIFTYLQLSYVIDLVKTSSIFNSLASKDKEEVFDFIEAEAFSLFRDFSFFATKKTNLLLIEIERFIQNLPESYFPDLAVYVFTELLHIIKSNNTESVPLNNLIISICNEISEQNKLPLYSDVDLNIFSFLMNNKNRFFIDS